MKVAQKEIRKFKLKAEVAKLRRDFEELKQRTQVLTNVQDTSSIVNISPNNFDSESKLLEDKEVNEFLESECKRSVSNEIRERNGEKKIQHTIFSEINSTTEISQDTISTINNDRKTIQSEWAKPRVEDSSQTFAESEQITIDQVQDNISSEIAKLKKIPYNQKVEQGLRHELSVCVKNDSSGINSGASAKAHNVFDIQIPKLSLEAIIRGSNKITTQNIVDLFNVAIKTRQKEILC
ncbi:15980_t:CDS:2, partial [Entrophospora sp. SA101]